MQHHHNLFTSEVVLVLTHSEATVEMRALSRDDYAAVCCLEQGHHAHPWSVNHLADSLENHCCVGLWHDSLLVAHAVLSFVAGEAELLLFVLHKEWRKKGVASAFLRAIMAGAAGAAASMFLEVRRSNQAAIYLYEACGFNEIGVRPAYYPASKGREDALIYAAELR